MEQKKILWIVVAVCVFVLIVFGAALLLYSPSRSTGQNLQQATAAAITPATKNDLTKNAAQSQPQIDPDSWVREPGNTPGIDPNAQPAKTGINLTIVNGDNTGANYGAVDVSGLTNPQTPPAQTSQTLPLSSIPGQDTSTTQASTATPATGSKATGNTTITNTIIKSSGKTDTSIQVAPSSGKTAVKASTVPAGKTDALKAAPKKLVPVTEFWLQTGSFSSKVNAEKARETLVARYLNAEIFTKDSVGKTTYRVRVGPYKSKPEAEYWLGTVKEIPDFANSFVSEVKTKK